MPRKKATTARKKSVAGRVKAVRQPPSLLTPEILQAQTDALAVAGRLLEESRLCRCQQCKALALRDKATALVCLVVAAMEATEQKSSGQYMAALRLRAECQASMPWCSAGGFAYQATDVVYDRCIRTKPVLSDGLTGAALLQRAAGRL